MLYFVKQKGVACLTTILLTAICFFLPVTCSEAAQGVPDSFGYRWTDNAYPEPTISSSWHDITSSGNYLWIDGDTSATIDIGFDFPFYGNLYSSLTISPNGYITFGGDGTLLTNSSVPSQSPPNNIIAPFWDNLTNDGYYIYGQDVYYEVIGTAPDRKLVILWDFAYIMDESQDPIDFEVILEEGSGNILFQYQGYSYNASYYDGISATIGIENASGTIGTQYSYNTATISDNVAVLFSTTSVQPGQEVTVNVPFVLEPYSYISATVLQEGLPSDARITGIDYTVEPKPEYSGYQWDLDISHIGHSGEFAESVCPDASCNGLAFSGTIYSFNGEVPFGTWEYYLGHSWETYFSSASLLIHYAYADTNIIPDDIALGIDPTDKTCDPGMVGNPINLYNGNKFELQQDLGFPSPNQNGFAFSRYYNSRTNKSGILGYGWSHSVSAILKTDNPVGGMSLLRIENETGKAHYFQANGEGRWDGVFDEKSYVLLEGENYVWYRKDGSKYQFSSQGQFAWFEDAVGNRETLSYDTNGRIATVTDEASGRVLTFHYTTNDLLDYIEGPVTAVVADGIWVTYGYDASNNLTSVTYADGSGFNYEYTDTDPHNITAKKDKMNHILTTWSYDGESDKAISSSTRDGKGVTLDYTAYLDGNGTIDITDAYGVTRTYTISKYNGIPRITGITGPGGCTSCVGPAPIRYEYDEQLNVIEKEYANGTINKYENFGERGNPGQITQALGTPEQKVINYTYHPSLNKPLSQTQTSILGTGTKETIWDYDDDGNTVPNENPGFLLMRTIERGYTRDQTGTIVSYEDITSYLYNAKGQVASIDGPLPGDQDKTELVYDPTTGDLLTVTTPLVGTVIFSEYDAAGNPEVITDNNDIPWLYMYDGRNREIFNHDYEIDYTTAGEIESITDYSGYRRSYTYEPVFGRMEEITDPAGNYLRYGYDGQGNRTSVEAFDPVDFRHYFMRYNYQSPDLPGKLWKTIKPDGTETVFAYDEMGKVASVLNNARTTSYYYDALGRLTSVVQPGVENATTNYEYDLDDNLIKVTDAEQRITNYLYDDRGNLLEVNSPDTGLTRLYYDAYGWLFTKTNNKAITVTYSHDSQGRLTGVDYPTDLDLVYEYDTGANGKGKLARITDGSGVYEYQYDIYGNLIEEKAAIDATTYITRYSYDGAHRLTGITYPSGRAVTFSRGTTKDITAISTRKGGSYLNLADAVSHLPFGPLNQLTYGNGIANSLGFDEAYQLDSISSGIQELSISRYPDGLVDLIQNALDPSRDQDFNYNSHDELQDATGIYGVLSYGYDLTGNRLSRATVSDSVTYEYEPLTNKIDYTSGAVITEFSHDQNGNIISKGNYTFNYNEDNRLINAEQNSTMVGEYIYNGAGQRVKKIHGGVTTLYFYDTNGNLIEERSSDGSPPINYVYLGNQLLARLEKVDRGSCSSDLNWDGIIDGGDLYDLAADFGRTDCGDSPCVGDLDADWDVDGLDIATITLAFGTINCTVPEEKLYYFHTDHLGTSTHLTDEIGTIAWQADYQPFGSALISVETVVNNLRFPGQYYDAETGLHYNWHRYYDPSTGRYLTPDPIGLAGGINPFIYVQNNPVNAADPLGLDAIYINYDYYPVTTPIGKLPLGHGAVVAVDPSTGTTKYYEFGRYGDPKGVVRGAPDLKIPDVVIGKNGLPTKESLNRLYDFLSHNFGHDVHVSPTYYPNSDYQGTIDYAERFKRNHPDYDSFGNNCKTFGRAAATACQEGSPCQ